MIKDIPLSFKAQTEDYIIVPILQMFCSENKLSTKENKIDLIKSIINFANINSDNEFKVLNWLDHILKEGVKHVFACKIFNGNLSSRKKEMWEELIKNKFDFNEHKFIVQSESNQNFKLQKFDVNCIDDQIKSISLNFSILLDEVKSINLPHSTIIYPIFIDIDLINGYIIGRAKSKSNISRIDILENGKKEIKKRTSSLKLFKELSELILNKLQIEQETRLRSTERFKNVFYNIIEECTGTPIEIQNKLSLEKENIQKFITNFFERNSISTLNNENFINAVADINIFMEKYISVNYKDQSIFTNQRYAYPIKISATDTDLSSVEETSFDYKPLQCSPIFYDNKKIIKREKKCDTFTMMFKRTPRTYLPRNVFPVRFYIEKGVCVLQFFSYVLEEEIQNVLSKVIRN